MALRRKFTQTKFFRAFVVSILLLFFLVWQPRFVMEPLRVVFSTIAWPIQGMVSSVAFEVRDTFSFVTSIGNLKRENEYLVQENIRLAGENAKWQSVANENDVLRRELSLLPRDRYELRAAEVIGRDAAGLGNWLTIDQGSLQGIERGMVVTVSGGVLIGRVVEVFPGSARVMLLTNPESVVSGVTLEGNAQGIIKGEYGLGIVLDMVPQDMALQATDRLVTSGLGGEIPKDLVIGAIQNIRPSSDHLYQRASVVSPVNFSILRYVFVIKKSLVP